MPDFSAHLWHLPLFWQAAAEPAAMAGHLHGIWWKCTPRAAGPAADSSVLSCALSFSFVLEVNDHGSNKTVFQNGPFICLFSSCKVWMYTGAWALWWPQWPLVMTDLMNLNAQCGQQYQCQGLKKLTPSAQHLLILCFSGMFCGLGAETVALLKAALRFLWTWEGCTLQPGQGSIVLKIHNSGGFWKGNCHW